MNVTCLKENLKRILNIISGIVGKNLTLPILNNILIEAQEEGIKISATNLEIGLSAFVSGKIEKKGVLTVPAKTLTSFISNLPNKKIQLEAKKNILKISSDNYKAEINGLPAEEFPIIPKFSQKFSYKIPSETLKEALSSVVSVAAISDSRPEITGVFLMFENSKVLVAATDSFRLAEKTILLENKKESTKQEIKTILPQKTAQELTKILSENTGKEVSIGFENNQIFLKIGDFQIVSRLIDGVYPDYQQIIPRESAFSLALDKEELISSIRLASVFSSKINETKFKFDLKRKKLTVSSADPEVGTNESEIALEVEKPEAPGDKILEISFNHRFLLDGLNNLKGKKAIFSLNSETTPGVLRSASDSSYLYLLMPINAN